MYEIEYDQDGYNYTDIKINLLKTFFLSKKINQIALLAKIYINC